MMMKIKGPPTQCRGCYGFDNGRNDERGEPIVCKECQEKLDNRKPFTEEEILKLYNDGNPLKYDEFT